MDEFKTDNLADFLEYQQLCQGIIYLDEDIYEGDASKIADRLSFLQRRGVKEVTLVVRCPGGSAYEALSMYDLLKEAQADGMRITGKVQSWAASAAAMVVLQACGKRIGSPMSRYLVHELRSWKMFSDEKVSDKKDELLEMTKLQEIVCGIMAERTGRPASEVAALFERKEIWLSAQEAKAFGLIDEIEGY